MVLRCSGSKAEWRPGLDESVLMEVPVVQTPKRNGRRIGARRVYIVDSRELL